ncbi:FAD/NAD(P)-binding domain-containing protein [Glonium stellatum]|uniref:FAD/NAD(P)-binding domain-containing protein n=1 Tax=Glonium stellatum TaxID=574774 RepID=A0A8E2EW20_9PEZI|nr:FAD/NAD(P)-binding domain-containing protein [Glonium stellatum]
MESSKTPFDIAIIGAGIGGLALAIGLLRQNVTYTLYEGASEYAAVGAGVALGPNALRAMDLIDSRFRGLYDSISTGNTSPEKEHSMMEALMIEEGFGEKHGWTGASWGSKHARTSAHRKALLDIMTSLIPLSTVKFNKRVNTLHQEGTRVFITFEDGEVVEADAVVGCDGIKSITRRAVLGATHPDLVEPTYAGRYAYRAIVPMQEAVKIIGCYAPDATMFMGPGASMSVYPISKGTECNVVALKKDNQPWIHKEFTKEVTREEMVGDFNIDSRLVKLLEWAKPLRWSLHHHISTPTYFKNCICILGDSAHASTPFQAAGAAQCLEDALILSRLLGLVQNSIDILNVFKVYDLIRRPRAQHVVQTSIEAGEIFSFSHPEIGNDMKKIVENCNRRFEWIWEHDLEADVKEAEEQFRILTMQGEQID